MSRHPRLFLPTFVFYYIVCCSYTLCFFFPPLYFTSLCAVPLHCAAFSRQMMTDHPSEALLNACDGSHDDDHHNIDEEEEDVHF